MAKKLPNMTEDGRTRVLAFAFNKQTRRDERAASKYGKCNSDPIFEKEVKNVQALLLSKSAEYLRPLPIKLQVPTLAAYVGTVIRERAVQALGFDISRRTWTLARRHCIHPGPFKPVKQIKHSRQRLPRETLLTFLNLLESKFFQNHAVGVSRHTFQNGEEETFDRVSVTADQNTIAREYYKLVENFIELDGIKLPADEDRCTKNAPRVVCDAC